MPQELAQGKYKMTRQIQPTSRVFNVERLLVDVEVFRLRHGLTHAALARAAGVTYQRLQSLRDGRTAPFDVVVRVATAVDVSLDDYVREDVATEIVQHLEIELKDTSAHRWRRPSTYTTSRPRAARPDVEALARDIHTRALELGFDEVPAVGRSAWAVDVRNDGYTTQAWRIARRVAATADVSKEAIIGILLSTTTPMFVTVGKLAEWLGEDPARYMLRHDDTVVDRAAP